MRKVFAFSNKLENQLNLRTDKKAKLEIGIVVFIRTIKIQRHGK